MKRKRKLLLLFLTLLFSFSAIALPLKTPRKAESFRDEQNRYTRVRAARAEKESYIKNLFNGKGLPYPPDSIIIVVYKIERTVELWSLHPSTTKYELIRTYPICMLSGIPGPKRCEGDMQIPEGFYKITLFNPVSDYHLSIMINYPNKSDKILGCKRPGGLIFIHGNCVTIGCIPITDDLIKELYLICVDVKSSSKKEIPVYIFPCRFSGEAMKTLEKEFINNPEIMKFWKNLKTGYDLFQSTKKRLEIEVDTSGIYKFKAAR